MIQQYRNIPYSESVAEPRQPLIGAMANVHPRQCMYTRTHTHVIRRVANFECSGCGILFIVSTVLQFYFELLHSIYCVLLSLFVKLVNE